MNTTYISIAILVFLIYWILIRNGSLKQGIGKYNSGDYWGAIEDLTKATLKNPDNFQAYFYLGMCYYQLSRFGGSQEQFCKISAIKNLIMSSDLKSQNGKANNIVELIIVNEQDEENRSVLISNAKKQISIARRSLRKEYSWLINA